MASKPVSITLDRGDILERIAWYQVNGDTAAAVAVRRLLDWAQPQPYRLTEADEADIRRRMADLSRPAADPVTWA